MFNHRLIVMSLIAFISFPAVAQEKRSTFAIGPVASMLKWSMKSTVNSTVESESVQSNGNFGFMASSTSYNLWGLWGWNTSFVGLTVEHPEFGGQFVSRIDVNANYYWNDKTYFLAGINLSKTPGSVAGAGFSMSAGSQIGVDYFYSEILVFRAAFVGMTQSRTQALSELQSSLNGFEFGVLYAF